MAVRIALWVEVVVGVLDIVGARVRAGVSVAVRIVPWVEVEVGVLGIVGAKVGVGVKVGKGSGVAKLPTHKSSAVIPPA